MADETAVDTFDEDEEFEKWLAEADEEEDMQESAEVEYVKEDDKALKTAIETKRMVAKHFKEERVEKKVDAFLASASDTEKELFAIFRKGDEDDKQLDRLIELVKTKANVAEGKIAGEIDEEVEGKAAEMAQEMIGSGPLKQGARIKPDPEAAEREMLERIAAGDMNALFESVVTLPPVR